MTAIHSAFLRFFLSVAAGRAHIRLVTEQGRQPAEVAKELGICIDTLRAWLKATGVALGQTSRSNREQQRLKELEAENRALRKQLGEKDEVIDVLKKSVGILSRP